MKTIRRTAIFLIAFVLGPTFSYANWGGSGTVGSFGAGHLQAIGTKDIELVTEDLHIDLYKDHAMVTVEYLFHNTGDDVLVKAGFPNIIYGKKNEIEDYLIEVDGQKIKYKSAAGTEVKYITLPENLTMGDEEEGVNKLTMSWFVSQVQFKKDEEKKIKISYISHYQMSAGGYSDDTDFDPETFRYLLSTGGAWKGPIKKGKITITAVSVEPEHFILSPKGRFAKQDNTYTWEFENLKPTRNDDILIEFNNPVSIKMNYHPEDQFGLSYYSLQDKQGQYYYVFHSYTLQASTTLDPKESYAAGNVKDMKRENAWCEGKDNDGVGEYLLLTLKEPMEVSQVGIIPGYVKSKNTYFNNNRVAQVTAIVNGTYKVTAPLLDEYVSYSLEHPKAYQYVDLRSFQQPVKTIKLIIDKVYPGTKFHDTCISKIVLRKQFAAKPNVHGAR